MQNNSSSLIPFIPKNIVVYNNQIENFIGQTNLGFNVKNTLQNIKLIDTKNYKESTIKANRIIRSMKKEQHVFKGGFYSYTNNYLLGNMLELSDAEILLNKLSVFTNNLEDNKLYTVLINLTFLQNGRIVGSTAGKSLVVSNKVDLKFVGLNIQNRLITAQNTYSIMNHECQISLLWREWLTKEELENIQRPVNEVEILNSVLLEESKNTNFEDKLTRINRFMDVNALNNYLKDFPKFDSVNKMPRYTLGVNDDELEEKILILIMEIEKNDKVRISVHTKTIIKTL